VEILETIRLPFDLLIISPSWNAFVRVKRMRARIHRMLKSCLVLVSVNSGYCRGVLVR
jgi:hypothetical protein